MLAAVCFAMAQWDDGGRDAVLVRSCVEVRTSKPAIRVA